MRDSLAVNDDVSIAHGQLQIIIKSALYSFAGEYTLTDDDTPMLSRAGLQFDYLVSFTDYNLAVYFKDVSKIEALLEPSSLGSYVKFKVRLVTAEGLVKILTGQGKIFSIYKKTTPELKKAGQDLKNTHSLLQNIIDAPNLGLTVFRAIRDENGRIIDFEHEFVNRRTRETMGFDPTGFRLTGYGPDGVEQLAAFKEVMETGKTNTYTRKAQSGIVDGWFMFSNARLSENQLVHIWEDITDLKKTEQELQKSRALLQSVFDVAVPTIGVFKTIHNEQSEIIDFEWGLINARAKQQGAIDLIGKRLSEQFPGVKETGILDRFRKVAETGIPDEFEIHYTHEGLNAWYRNMVVKTDDGLVVTTEDISAWKNSEQDLKKDFELIKQTEEVGGTGSWDFDPTQNSLRWSDGMYHIFEMPPGTPVHPETYVAYALPEDRAIATQIATSLHSDLKSFGQTLRILVNGKIKTLKIKAIVLPNEQGEPGRIIGVDADVTATLESEHFISRVAETIPDMLSVINLATGKIEYANRGPFAQHGFDSDAMQQRTVAERRTFIHEHDKAAVAAYFQKFYELEDDTTNTVEYRAQNDTGEWLWFRARGKVFKRDASGTPTHCVNVVQNITLYKDAEQELMQVKEQLARQAEDKYRALFNSIDEGFCILEMIYNAEGKAIDYKFLETNPAFEQQTDLHDAVGKTIRELRPSHEDAWLEIYGKVAKTGQPTRFIQPAEFLKGQWYELYAFPISSGNNNKVAVLFNDITHRHHTEIQLKELNKRLRELDKAKTKFFSNVSHEFRTPLTLLLAPLDDLLREERHEPWPAKDLQRLQLMRRNIIRLQKLVNALLDFSRVESQRMEAIFQPTDLPKLTQELASNFRSAIESAGLRYQVKTAAFTEPIYVNRDMWEKIVLNLISNAFKFTHQGKIEVVLKSKKKYAELRVRDTGVGISAENISRVFERFTRIEGVKARTHEGSGIGLALVKELILLHNGTIKVNSTEGSGSEFIVSIPKGKNHLPPRQIFESVTSITTSSIPEAFLEESNTWLTSKEDTRVPETTTRDTVLVADDNADMREYLTSILSRYYNVVTAENGQKVLDHLDKGVEPVLVLADVMMPEIDGYTLVQTLRKNSGTANMPIVLLSARSSEAAKIKGLQAGADDYVAKPFSANELITLVSARIQIAQTRREAEKELNLKNIELEHRVRERTLDLVRSRHNLILLNESLSKKNLELKTVNDELSTFAFIASHDLREPLRKIQFFSNELMHREGLRISSKGRELSDKIHASVQRMSDLIDDILTFSRASNTPRGKHESINLNALTQQVLDDLSETIAKSKARIEVGVLPELHGNPIQLSQLLLNLISNAIKFQPKNGVPVINISGMMVMGNQIDSPLAITTRRYFRLEVMDNGIGFQQQYAEKIFHMFQRLHTKTEYPGTGMGLAICKKVMENHNGFIVAKGKPGIGSVFCCYFPA